MLWCTKMKYYYLFFLQKLKFKFLFTPKPKINSWILEIRVMFLVFQPNKFYILILIASLLVHIADMFTYYYLGCVHQLNAKTVKTHHQRSANYMSLFRSMISTFQIVLFFAVSANLLSDFSVRKALNVPLCH